MRYPLTLPAMLERAERYFPHKEVVSRTASGIFRYTYREYGERVRRLAGALLALGVRKGDRIATLAWNQHRHLEAYFAIPSIGAVLHTCNLRLPPTHLAHIVNHAEDRILLVDADLVPLVESVAPELRTVERYVVMNDGREVPPTTLPNAASYEALVGSAEPLRRRPGRDDRGPAGRCLSPAPPGVPQGGTYTPPALTRGHPLG